MLKKFLIILFVILTTTSCTYSKQTPVNVEALPEFNTAYQSYVNKDFSSAIKILTKLQHDYPNSEALWLWLGTNYLELHEFKKAQECYTELLKLTPEHWAPYIGLAKVNNALNLTPIAVMYYDKAISLPSASEDVKAYYKNERKQAIEAQRKREGIAAYTNVKNPGITLNISPKDWYNAYFHGDADYWHFEYGYNGESVMDYNWTKLISVHFYNKLKFKNLTLDYIYQYQSRFIKMQAEILNSLFEFKQIEQPDESIYYYYSIPNFNESEYGRICEFPEGIYIVRYTAKRKTFLPNEQENILNILKSFKPNR